MLKKSPNDFKEYQTTTLKNGLRVLLINNSQSAKSAAALAVNAGHFNDPKDKQGLAHFVEHMLFLGTENFPEGSEYQQFINQHGGHHNAWTGSEHSCFFFDIAATHFSSALARFSDFFIAPLLADDFIVKERENIDAEFILKLKDDSRRLYDVHKSTVNPKHPFAQFSVGNSTTLADRDGKNISLAIQTFFQQYYRADYMTLVLEGPQPLAELNRITTQLFTLIKPATQPLNAIEQPLYLPSHQKIKIDVCPIKKVHQLIISFAMPGIDKYYQDKPASILAYLLGHEGKGSILSLLKKKQWAFALTAGSGINGSNYKDFNISITLTQLGEQHINSIVDIVLAYIALLKNNELDSYYQEKKNLSQLAFHYHEKMSPLENVSQLVINMQHYPEEDYIFGDYSMSGLSTENITALLKCLQVDNMRLMHISQNNHFSKKSHWYQVPYQVTAIATEQLVNWRAIELKSLAALRNKNKDNATLDSPAHIHGLFLPKPNPYIVTSPKVYENEQSFGLTTRDSKTPAKIINKNGLVVWYKQERSFKVPKGHLSIGIDSPFIVSSVANIAMTRLFVNLYTDTVIEENYQAELAGIHYHLYAHQGGMTLQLSGYSEKQPLLLARLLTRLKHPQVTQANFTDFKQQLVKHWQNSDQNKPISQLFATLSTVMQPNNPTSKALAQALIHISFSQYQHFTKQLFQQVTLTVLIHGNWLFAHAQQLSAIIEQAFLNNLDNKYNIQCPVTDIAGKATCLLPVNLGERDHTCVIYRAFEYKDANAVALAMITSHLLSPLFFQQMRTEKQYGYLVGVGYVPINSYPGIAFYIQSPHSNAFTLAQAMDEFISASPAALDDISPEQWQDLLQGLASQLQEKDHNLRIKNQHFWAAICNNDECFNQKERLLSALLRLTLTQVKTFITNQLVSVSQPDRFILYSQSDLLEQSSQPNGEVITDIDAFISASALKY